MDKVLWVKFGWSDYYRGEPVVGNFSHLAGQGNVGHEAYNFEPAADGTYYCYVPPPIWALRTKQSRKKRLDSRLSGQAPQAHRYPHRRLV